MAFLLKKKSKHGTVIPMRIFIFFITVLLISGHSHAKTFEQWQTAFKTQAIEQGIQAHVIHNALQHVKFLPRVIELDRKQPEGHMTFAQYKKNIVSKQRIEKGRAMYKQHRKLLEKTAKEYGVPAQYIVALWGIETNYGGFTGGTHTISALATLAYEGRRSEFFTAELINALKIINQGHISANSMKGSWAGALGQNQLMPSSFLAYAVDGNHDGRKDIWTTPADVFASTANYLSKSGWNADQRWGRRVIIPKNTSISQNFVINKTEKSLQFWQDKGLLTLSKQPVPVVKNMTAYLVQPDGSNGESYLAYNNYKVIMKWNRSTYFATSVGLLANAIAAAK